MIAIQPPTTLWRQWIQTTVPSATFITSSNEFVLPPDATTITIGNPLSSSQVLKLIHDMINQLTFFGNHYKQPSAPAFITPDNIIHIPSANIFVIHPNIFIPLLLPNRVATLYEQPQQPPTTIYVPPQLNTIPATITTQTCYYSIGQIIHTLWQPSTNTTINNKVTNFIATAVSSNASLVWDVHS